jgi:hypothetical protein
MVFFAGVNEFDQFSVFVNVLEVPKKMPFLPPIYVSSR